MGIKVNRIEKEFIFRGLIDKKITINIHGNKREFEGTLVDFDDHLLSVEIPPEADLVVGEEVRIFAFFQNNMHAFSGSVKEHTPGLVKINHPEGLYKKLQRKHERIRSPKNLTAFFTLKGKNFELNFPKTNRFASVEKPKIAEKFDESNIQALVTDYRRGINKRVEKNDIIILRNRNPSSFEERLMYQSGKILWIPSVQEGFPLEDPFPDGRVLTKRDIIQLEGESEYSDNVLNRRLEDVLDEKFREKVYSDMYCPLFYNQYFFGYIHLYNTTERKEMINEDLVEYINQFAKVLCYSLEVTGYFTSLADAERDFETTIIDISASGLLFAHPTQELSRDLLLHTDLKLTLVIDGRKLKIGARIIRKFKDMDRLFIGLQFLEIEPEDFRFLFHIIYGKPFAEEFEEHWEGGIPPPELHLE